MYRHADIYIGRYDNVADVLYQQNSTDIYWQYLLIEVFHLLCIECLETQVATSSHTLTDQRKYSILFLAHTASWYNNQTAVQSFQQNTL